jgi:predicted nucleic acid-binding protein
MRIAIIDSSCLINLAHLKLASKLRLFFDRVYVPRGVQIEVNRKHRARYLLNKLFHDGALQKCACKDETSFQFLIRELDSGEAEALVQAQEQGAEFFLADELKARAISTRRGLTPYGTVRLLAHFCRDGYAEDIWALVRKLKRERGFHVGDEVVEMAIALSETPIGRLP